MVVGFSVSGALVLIVVLAATVIGNVLIVANWLVLLMIFVWVILVDGREVLILVVVVFVLVFVALVAVVVSVIKTS